MKKIGRKIYYDINTGNVIIDTGELFGVVIETTLEDDINTYRELSERNIDSFNVIHLDYGQFRQDFIECNSYRVNLETLQLEFSYPDPSEPQQEPFYIKPLSESVNEQMDYLVDIDFRLSMVELGL